MVHPLSVIIGVTITVAQNVAELISAYRLVYSGYLNQDYTKEHEAGMWYLPHNALPTTTTFIVRRGNKVVATATLILGSGLPFESVFPGRCDELRRQGRILAEVSLLGSVAEGSTRERLGLVFQLMAMVTQYARSIGVTDFFIAIHPKHALMYERYLCLDRVAEGGSYGALDKAPPAVGLHWPLNEVESRLKSVEHNGAWQIFCGQQFAVEDLTPYRWGVKELRQFYNWRPDMFHKCSQEQMEHFRMLYPSFDWDRVDQAAIVAA